MTGVSPLSGSLANNNTALHKSYNAAGSMQGEKKLNNIEEHHEPVALTEENADSAEEAELARRARRRKQRNKRDRGDKKSQRKRRIGKGRDRNRSQEQQSSFTRRLWTKEEDEAITYLVRHYGIRKWTLISKKLQDKYHIRGRSGKQCRER